MFVHPIFTYVGQKWWRIKRPNDFISSNFCHGKSLKKELNTKYCIDGYNYELQAITDIIDGPLKTSCLKELLTNCEGTLVEGREIEPVPQM